MRNGSKKGHGLLGGLVAAIVTAVLCGALGLWVLEVCLGGADGDGLALALLVLYALMFLAIAAGVIAALVQRWREVRGGEEDEARKY